MITRPAIDRHSPTWVNLSEYMVDRLNELRMKNDATQSIEDTERLRGQITELKILLSLAKERGE